MHLVTLLAACIVDAALPCAPSSPAPTFVADRLPAIPVSDNDGAASSAALDTRLHRWQAFIREASRRFGLPEAWIRAVMAAEAAADKRSMVNPSPRRRARWG